MGIHAIRERWWVFGAGYSVSTNDREAESDRQQFVAVEPVEERTTHHRTEQITH
jgi:hypothetical protein